MKIFLDCDGVLADFDKRAMEILDGIKPRDYEGKAGEDALWEKIYSVPEFFYSLDPMPDMEELVRGVQKLGYHPTVLTGIPKPREHQLSSVPAAEQKRKWVAKHLGKEFEVITCRSKNKCLSIQNKGDVLVDDWTRYIPNWEAAGGYFIHHQYATLSLDVLAQYLDEYQTTIDDNAEAIEKIRAIV